MVGAALFCVLDHCWSAYALALISNRLGTARLLRVVSSQHELRSDCVTLALSLLKNKLMSCSYAYIVDCVARCGLSVCSGD